MSINSKLVTFAQQELVLSRNDTERDKINASIGQLEKVLKDKLGSNVKELIRFGSFTRNTILPRKYDPQSDVDLMIVFNTVSGKKTPGTYRSNILEVVASSYTKSDVKKDFPTIKLELGHIMFDIVPAYFEESGNNKTYYIPAANDNWRVTTPNDLNKLISQKNQSYEGNKSYESNIIRNLIRLCKYWNAASNYTYESYEMEKWILNRFLFHGENLYDKFISVMNDMAGDQAGVREALKWIKEYKSRSDEQKQLEWLQKLLPELK